MVKQIKTQTPCGSLSKLPKMKKKSKLKPMKKLPKKLETKYIVLENLHYMLNTHIQHSVGLRAFHITKIGRTHADGFYFEEFGKVKAQPYSKQLLSKIITPKNKVKGVEVEFNEYETVSISCKMRLDQLHTFDEAKLILIKYIANDFSDPSEHDYGEDGYQL